MGFQHFREIYELIVPVYRLKSRLTFLSSALKGLDGRHWADVALASLSGHFGRLKGVCFAGT